MLVCNGLWSELKGSFGDCRNMRCDGKELPDNGTDVRDDGTELMGDGTDFPDDGTDPPDDGTFVSILRLSRLAARSVRRAWKDESGAVG